MIEQQLAQFIINMSSSKLDESVLHLIKRNILDAYAGICASLKDQSMLKKMDAVAEYSKDERGILVWGLNKKVSAPDALFLNSILARRSDLLATYFSPNRMGAHHPSDTIALVLCLSDYLKHDTSQLMKDTFIACMLSGAFSDYFDPEQAGYDHDAQSVIYASILIAYMMGLNEDQLIEAQRIAGVFGCDINQTALGKMTDWKHCTYASCALRGMHIARFVQAGFKGPEDIYEGDAGINHFFPHAEKMLSQLPDLSRIVFKRWPALVFCQTPIDVALDIYSSNDGSQKIEEVKVETYSIAVENGATEGAFCPTSRAGRTHSIPYCVATALIKGTIEYRFFDDDFSRDSKESTITDLMKKVSVVENTTLTKRYPDEAPCKITVKFKDGTKLTKERNYPRGDPKDPLSDKDLEAKGFPYIADVMGESIAKEIIERIWNMEREKSLEWMTGPLNHRALKNN